MGKTMKLKQGEAATEAKLREQGIDSTGSVGQGDAIVESCWPPKTPFVFTVGM